MAKKFMNLLAAMAFIGGATTLFAQEVAKPTKTGEGTLMVQDKNCGEEVIAVVLSGQAISSEKLKDF
jgi:hypothetical protein